MASHFKDPGIKYGRSREKGAVDADVAAAVVQKIVNDQIGIFKRRKR